MNQSPPKISIITITLNSERFIRNTIESVLSQSYKNIEYIVIDGASTDKTVAIVGDYIERIDFFSSESDHGIADAMNKGLAAATGDYILLLHSDDYLVDARVIEHIAPFLGTGKDIYLCSIYRAFGERLVRSKPRGLNPWMNLKTGVYHQGAFCSRNLFDRIGLFDTSLTIAMDYDFFLRAYRAKASAAIIDLPIAVMRMVGVSSRRDWPTLQRRFAEERAVHEKSCNHPLLRAAYLLYWALYIPYKKIHCRG